MRHAAVVLAMCAMATAAPSSAQAAAIRGRVVADQAGDRPAIANARVPIGPAARADPAFTDGDGRFEFTGLAGGRYTLTSEKTGYAKTRYGASNDLEPPLAIPITEAAPVDGIE